MYKNERGKVIYVGKAVDLYHRVGSYFSGRPHDLKTMQLVSNIHDIETIVVQSEIEALILEANLIKKYLPLYNIRLTDDKDYLYIGITNEEYPKIITARKPELKNLKKYFGPFPSSTTVKTTLKRLRRIFPWCANPAGSRLNRPGLRADGFKRGRPCFYYHIKQCPGACVGEISPQDYKVIINRFSKFLDGKKDELYAELTEEMENAAKNLDFEEAGRLKKIISGIEYITAPTKITQYLANPNFLEDITQQSLVQLQKDLNLPDLPSRIECYDISNFQGTDSTGSMVVLTNGEIDKSQYRKFKIKITGKPNDFAMHAEMMRRRLRHDEWGYPQLFLIDGGRGQVRAAFEEIMKYKLLIKDKNPEVFELLSRVAVFGIAKREEWLYPPEGEVVKLPKRSLALRLLQKIRDESHRFAITYHRKLRKKSSGY